MAATSTWAFNHPYLMGSITILLPLAIFIGVTIWLYHKEIAQWIAHRKTSLQTGKKDTALSDNVPKKVKEKKTAKEKQKIQKAEKAEKPKSSSSKAAFVLKLQSVIAQMRTSVKALFAKIAAKKAALKDKTLTKEAKPKEVKPAVSKLDNKNKAASKTPASNKAKTDIAQQQKPVVLKLQILSALLVKHAKNIAVYVKGSGKNLQDAMQKLLQKQTTKKESPKPKAKLPQKPSLHLDELSKDDILAAFAYKEKQKADDVFFKSEIKEKAPELPQSVETQEDAQDSQKQDIIDITTESVENISVQQNAIKEKEEPQDAAEAIMEADSLVYSTQEDDIEEEEITNLLDGPVPLSLKGEQSSTNIMKQPPYKFTYVSGGSFYKSYKNWTLALSSPYLMTFHKPIDQFCSNTQTLLKIERITNKVQLLNRLEKLRVGFVRYEHKQLSQRVLKISEANRAKFLNEHQGHQAYAKFQSIAKHPSLFENVDFLVFDTILALSLVREACSPELQLLSEDEAKMLSYYLAYPLYAKKYDWQQISDYFRAGVYLYYAKSTKLTKKLSDNLDELLVNPKSPWNKLEDMNYALDKSEYQIHPPMLSEQEFDTCLGRWVSDIYGSQPTYKEALMYMQRENYAENFCGFLNSFSTNIEYLSNSALKPIGSKLGLYEHELRSLATGFILLGSNYATALVQNPDAALASAAEHLLYVKERVVVPYVCFGLCTDSLAQATQYFFEQSTQEGQSLFGLNLTIEDLEKVRMQAQNISNNYSDDWDDYPQFITWLHYQSERQ